MRFAGWETRFSHGAATLVVAHERIKQVLLHLRLEERRLDVADALAPVRSQYIHPDTHGAFAEHESVVAERHRHRMCYGVLSLLAVV